MAQPPEYKSPHREVGLDAHTINAQPRRDKIIPAVRFPRASAAPRNRAFPRNSAFGTFPRRLAKKAVFSRENSFYFAR